jgi:hypothetical protein
MDDIAAACAHVMGLLGNEFLAAGTYPLSSHVNVGTGIGVTIAQLAWLIAKTVGCEG